MLSLYSILCFWFWGVLRSLAWPLELNKNEDIHEKPSKLTSTYSERTASCHGEYLERGA